MPHRRQHDADETAALGDDERHAEQQQRDPRPAAGRSTRISAALISAQRTSAARRCAAATTRSQIQVSNRNAEREQQQQRPPQISPTIHATAPRIHDAVNLTGICGDIKPRDRGRLLSWASIDKLSQCVRGRAFARPPIAARRTRPESRQGRSEAERQGGVSIRLKRRPAVCAKIRRGMCELSRSSFSICVNGLPPRKYLFARSSVRVYGSHSR